MLTTPLRPYQEEAVDRFIDRGDLLMAWEMGTGKTIAAIAAAEDLLGENDIDMCAIVCGASLKYQTAQKIAEYTDVKTREKKVGTETITIPTEDYCVIIDGTPAQRAKQYEYVRLHRPDYVILGYENVVNDWVKVRKIKPGMIALDEISAIKTFKAQRTKKIKRWTAPFRLGMSGTPVENRPEELFSIMQWINEQVLGRYDLFDKAYIKRNVYGGVETYRNLPVLHARLAPAMSRKTALDEDVRDYMPEVYPDVWQVKASTKVAKAYEVMSDSLVALLKALGPTQSFDVHAYYSGSGDDHTQQGKIMARQVCMEMLLDHPELVRISAAKYNDPLSTDGSAYAAQIVADGLLDGVEGSAKLDRLVDEVWDIMHFNDANKVIIFTRYREMLDLIEADLSEYGCVQFHGGMSPTQKAEAIARYTRDPEARVFLSSHAGGYGVDLFMANHLINFDHAQSSGKQDQINARHVRGSSLFDTVFVHDMLVKGSTDVRNYKRLAFKRSVARAIVDNEGSDLRGRVENDVQSLTKWLEANHL